MSNVRTVAIVAALTAVVGGGGYFVWRSSQDPAGLAMGRPGGKPGQTQRSGQIWAKLQKYKDSYLRRFLAAFDKPAPTARDTLEAFNELSFQVTGPGGFWRKDVPNHWLGCKNQPESASCAAIDTMAEEMAKWDTLSEKIVALDEAAAGAFLDEHATEILDYLDTMVPDDTSSAGMQKTALFEKSLKAAMQSDGML